MTKPPADPKAERLAAALRANLRRRKAPSPPPNTTPPVEKPEA